MEAKVKKAENVNNARAVFEQYWLQARHIENERLWLTNVFVLIFAGLLGLITVEGLEWYVSTFGALLSIIGLLAMHDLRIWFIRFSRLAEKIMVNELDITEYDVGRYRKVKGKSASVMGRFWGLQPVFIVFYSTMLALWITLLLKGFGLKNWLWLVFIGIVSFSLIFYGCVLLPQEKRSEEEVGTDE